MRNKRSPKLNLNIRSTGFQRPAFQCLFHWSVGVFLWSVDMDPCISCGSYSLQVQAKGPHHARYCTACGAKQHTGWLQKTAIGMKPRSVQTTHEMIKPKMRASIIDRASARCEICGAKGVLLHVGHFLSVDEGHASGLTDDEINSCENLYCSCEECNLGQGRRPVSIRILAAIIRARVSVNED